MIFEVSATITTDSGGDATVYLGSKLRGRVQAIKYAPGTLDTGADLTITGETTGVPILVQANAGTSTVWYYPRVIPNKNTDGSAFTDIETDIFVLNERIKVVVAQGGDTLTGTITAYVDVCEDSPMLSSVALTFTGNGTNYIGSRLRGKIKSLSVTADSNVTNNFDIAITGETTGVPILTDTTVANNATTWFYPRVIPNKNTDGSAFTDVGAEIEVLNERIKCVTTLAGTTGIITVTVFYEHDV